MLACHGLAHHRVTSHLVARHGVAGELRVGALSSSVHPMHALHLILILIWVGKPAHVVRVVSAGTVDTRSGWHTYNHGQAIVQ